MSWLAAATGLGAVAGFLGQGQTNQKSWDIAQAANAFSAEQAQKQMDFQKEMRATQYQTAVEDLKTAGLNPMLAYTQGGAGVPAGAMGSVSTPQYKSPLSSGKEAAAAIASVMADVDKKDAETTEAVSRTTVNEQQAKLIDAQTNLAILEMPNVPQKLKNMIADQMLAEARRTATGAQESATRLDTLIRKTGDLPEAQSKGKYHKDTPYNPFMLKDAFSGVNSAAGALQSIKGTNVLPGVYNQGR
jgi:hypothetical protein